MSTDKIDIFDIVKVAGRKGEWQVIVGLLILAVGFAHHFRPNQEISNCYFKIGERIGYSADGRKWVVQERLGNYSRVWQIKSNKELLYSPPISPSRFITRSPFSIDKQSEIFLSIADGSEIMTLGDSAVIYFHRQSEEKND